MLSKARGLSRCLQADGSRRTAVVYNTAIEVSAGSAAAAAEPQAEEEESDAC
jgi:hypothetical protein